MPLALEVEVLWQEQQTRRCPHAGKVLGLVRIDAPEAAKGKPCGASHIPKQHKCSKGTGSTTNTPNSSRSASGLKRKSAAVGLTLAGAFALGFIASNYRKKTAPLSNLGVSKPLLNGQQPPSINVLPARSPLRPSNRQLRTIESYINSSASLNHELRSGRTLNSYESSQVRAIDAWMSNTKPVQGTYWRGVSSDRTYAILSKARVGDSFTDPGYSSFSSRDRIAMTFARGKLRYSDSEILIRLKGELHPLPYDYLQGYIDKRSRAKYRNTSESIRGFTTEQEALAPRNTTYRITRISPDIPTVSGRRSYKIFDVEIVPSAVVSVKGGKPAKGRRATELELTRLYGSSYEFSDNEWED